VTFPFKGTNLYETLTLILDPNIKARKPIEIKPQTPLILSNFTMKCMEKEPSQRFQSMEEVLQNLANIKN
jgi:serine/threonine protein kinase